MNSIKASIYLLRRHREWAYKLLAVLIRNIIKDTQFSPPIYKIECEYDCYFIGRR